MEWHIEVWLFYMNCIEVQWLNTAFITKALCHWLVPELVCQILFGVASFDNGYSLNLNIKYNKFYYTLSIFRCYHQYFLRHGLYMGVPNVTCSYSILHWAVKILIRLQNLFICIHIKLRGYDSFKSGWNKYPKSKPLILP